MPDQPKKILVVDDSGLSLELASEALQSEGYVVFTATNLEEIETACRETPDLILMDVQMPEAFGSDIAMILKQARGIDSPILLWSTLPETELVELAEEAGVDGHVCKSEGIEHLIEQVATLFGRLEP